MNPYKLPSVSPQSCEEMQKTWLALTFKGTFPAGIKDERPTCETLRGQTTGSKIGGTIQIKVAGLAA